MNDHDENSTWLLDLVTTPSGQKRARTLSFTEGSRNTNMTSLAGALVRKGCHGSALEGALVSINAGQENPLPDTEVIGIARSVSRYAGNSTIEFDDVSLSRTFGREISNRLCHTDSQGWMYYRDGCWRTESGDAAIQEAAKLFLEAVVAGVQAVADPSDDEVRKLVNRLRTHAKVKALISLVQSEAAVQRSGNDFDAHQNLLNVMNGTLELTDDGYNFRGHRAEDLLTKMADVEFNPDADCPIFDSVLSDALGPDEGAFFLRFMGYAASGTFDQQVFGIFYGAGANGKSTLVNEIQACLGGYAVNVETSTFMTQKFSGGIRNDLARLRGARLAVSNELGIGEILDGPLIKKLTGGDKITARLLYKEHIEFAATAVPLFVTNARPVIDGGDAALLRRVMLLNFPNVVPPDERDPALPKKLRFERSGIFNRVLEGLVDYRRGGGLKPPPSVIEDTRSYGDNSDMIGLFLVETTIQGVEHSASAGELLSAYRAWAMQMGIKPLSGPQFKHALEKRPGIMNKRAKSGVVWTGLTFKPPFA